MLLEYSIGFVKNVTKVASHFIRNGKKREDYLSEEEHKWLSEAEKVGIAKIEKDLEAECAAPERERLEKMLCHLYGHNGETLQALSDFSPDKTKKIRVLKEGYDSCTKSMRYSKLETGDDRIYNAGIWARSGEIAIAIAEASEEIDGKKEWYERGYSDMGDCIGRLSASGVLNKEMVIIARKKRSYAAGKMTGFTEGNKKLEWLKKDEEDMEALVIINDAHAGEKYHYKQIHKIGRIKEAIADCIENCDGKIKLLGEACKRYEDAYKGLKDNDDIAASIALRNAGIAAYKRYKITGENDYREKCVEFCAIMTRWYEKSPETTGIKRQDYHNIMTMGNNLKRKRGQVKKLNGEEEDKGGRKMRIHKERETTRKPTTRELLEHEEE